MRRVYPLGVLILALLALSAVPARAAGPEVGAHSLLHTCCTTPAGRSAVFAEAKALGARSVRLDIEMNGVFTTNWLGVVFRDWSKVDAVAGEARRAGLDVDAVLIGSPVSAPGCTAGGLRCPPADPAAWAGQAAEVARRTGFASFEVWNEPDGPAFTGTAEQFGALQAATYAAVKRERPEATVVLAATQKNDAPAAAWLARALAVPGASGGFDVGSVHLRGPVSRVTALLAARRAQLAAGRPGVPMWVTEHGRGRPPRAQAAYLARSVPALGRAGARRVYLTLFDAPPGPYETEGLVAGQPDQVSAHQRRPAFAVGRRLAGP